MSSAKISSKASFLKGLEVGRSLWRLAKGDAAAQPEDGPFQMRIDLQSYGYKLFKADMRGTFQIDWGDGASETVNNTGSSGIEHEYPALGVYTITIEGQLLRLAQGSWSRNALTSVTALLSPLPASLETIYYAFSECGGLTSIPSNLFSRCTGLKNLTGCFAQSAIAAIPPGLFDACANVVSLESCFANCTALTSIPAGLFGHCGTASNFKSCFLGCTGITSIPAGLFDACTKAQNFSGCFNQCTSLTDVPDGLFHCQQQASVFTSCFSWCRALVTIPGSLFDGCTAAAEFDSCFKMCTALASIPPELFSDCPNAVRFYSCFSSCTALTAIPEGLFDANPGITHLNECFLRCSNLTHAPELWTRFSGAAHTKCFTNCLAADNYDEIPDGWK